MNFFSSIAASQTALTQLAAKAVTFVNDENVTAIRCILDEFEVPTRNHREAFQQLITGCAIGGCQVDIDKAVRIEARLAPLEMPDVDKKRAARTLARTLLKQIIVAGHDERFGVLVATELLGAVTDRIKGRNERLAKPTR